MSLSLEIQELDQITLEQMLKLVHKYTGITMNSSKKALLQGRLRPRVRDLGLHTYSDYIEYLSSHKEEVQEFVNIITTNETSFFRTQRVWDFFSNEYLPEWVSRNPGKTLNIWSAASSSGEEVYTIGISCEQFRQKHPGFDYQILGTDISTEVLKVGETGEYGGRSIENFKTNNRPLFDKFLIPTESRFKVAPEIRARIRFASHNLFTVPKQKEFFDIVFLRNVMIYFETLDQEKVLENISRAILPNGTLVIGESESLNNLKTSFIFKSPLIYEKSRNQ